MYNYSKRKDGEKMKQITKKLKNKRIICIETGEVFSSRKDLMQKLKVFVTD